MTSTEHESEQARQLRQGVRVVQLNAPAGPDFSRVPVAARHYVAGVTPGPGRDLILRVAVAAVEIGAALDASLVRSRGHGR